MEFFCSEYKYKVDKTNYNNKMVITTTEKTLYYYMYTTNYYTTAIYIYAKLLLHSILYLASSGIYKKVCEKCENE